MDIHNSIPTISTASGLTPMEIFSSHKNSTTNVLSNIHTFGCPIFVLEPSFHQNHKIPPWKLRSHVGVYLGHSPEHASFVPLPSSLQQFAFTASTDTFRFGNMQHEPDRHLFKADMKQEVLDLLSSGTLKLAPCSAIPHDNKPLQTHMELQKKEST